MKEEWHCLIPVVCEETGYYGGEFVFGCSFLSKKKTEEQAFKYLIERIQCGMIKRKDYG